MCMEKQKAIEMLGGSPSKAASAMGYKSVQAIYLWPDVLPTSIADRVNGAVMRLKAFKPARKQPAKVA